MPENINNESISNDEIKSLLAENLKLVKETHEMVQKIKRHIVLEQVLNVVKILLIIVPVVLSIIYLPTLLKPYIEQYQQAIGLDAGTNLDMKNIQNAIKGLNQ